MSVARGFNLNGKQAKALAALIVVLIAGALGIGGNSLESIVHQLGLPSSTTETQRDEQRETTAATTLANIPAYTGEPYIFIAADDSYPQGTPTFTQSEIGRAERGAFESYSPLDSLGRCGTALACVGEETMPTTERGDISEIHPSGWRQHFYDFVDQEALYNRCHLIARSLSGEDANAQNLITGTRYMNTQGMLPFEEDTVAYIRRTGNHVLYRATPMFEGDNLVASGVHLEARSVEDDGAGICFNVYCYNVEPGVGIDYGTGNNWAA